MRMLYEARGSVCMPHYLISGILTQYRADIAYLAEPAEFVATAARRASTCHMLTAWSMGSVLVSDMTVGAHTGALLDKIRTFRTAFEILHHKLNARRILKKQKTRIQYK